VRTRDPPTCTGVGGRSDERPVLGKRAATVTGRRRTATGLGGDRKGYMGAPAAACSSADRSGGGLRAPVVPGQALALRHRDSTDHHREEAVPSQVPRKRRRRIVGMKFEDARRREAEHELRELERELHREQRHRKPRPERRPLLIRSDTRDDEADEHN
jgi:hypothetical protein